MAFDSDVALIGTGVAPLVAANYLLTQGKRVLLLNPDLDFFLEDSELPFDPLLPKAGGKFRISPANLTANSAETALSELRPDFPGAIEFWNGAPTLAGFRDAEAPFVRQRGRLWISSHDHSQFWELEQLESVFVEASDAGLNPQFLDGILACKKFPGFSSAQSADLKGLLLPKLCDVDVSRYRNGLLEFVRERAGSDGVICGVNQMELMPGGIRFHAASGARTARIRDGILVFWTPRLSPWILNQAKQSEIKAPRPLGVRQLEQWTLVSRDELDPSIIGMVDDLAVWAEVEGEPDTARRLHLLSVLKSGPLLELEALSSLRGEKASFGSGESFKSLSELSHQFLHWDRFSIRSMRPRSIFEWKEPGSFALSPSSDLRVQVFEGCDGSLVDVVKTSRRACKFLEESEAR